MSGHQSQEPEVSFVFSEAVYTIGHSNHAIGAFIALLERHGVAVLADVRSSPYSRLYPQFNQGLLAAALKEAGVDYLFLGAELGARPNDPACYVKGQADFSRMAARPVFKTGIELVLAEAGRRRVALLCAEREPLECHRTILVCHHLRRPGLAIKHILADGTIEDHRDLEQRLIKAAGLLPTLFDYQIDEADRLEQAYDHQARAIARRIEEEKG